MPDSGFADDDWDELARELNVDKAPPPQPETHTPDAELPEGDDAEPAFDENDGSLFDDGDPAGEGDTETEMEAGEGEPAGEGGPGDDQPGTGRKRRRRRRRRKKGAGPAANGETGEPGPAAEEADEPVAEYGVAVRSVSEADVGTEEDFATVEAEEPAEGMALAAEEDTGGEVLRDLIAHWNVPSWDEIVTGLNRPDR
jgi:ribonuclease E